MSELRGKLRKTQRITFNLRERGYSHLGQDRSNVDIEAWINAINSKASQELIKSGGMLGYYGHQVRMLWGVNPPETAILDGKLITITPALRTVELYADKDGNVTHRQEFLETAFGESALDNYTKKIGGFSLATNRVVQGGMIIPTMPCGADYVFQPNYALNVGDGALYDSIHADGQDIVSATIRASFLEMYDSVHATNFYKAEAEALRERALEAERKIEQAYENKMRRQSLIKTKNESLLDSALCPTEDFDTYLSRSNEFMSAKLVDSIEEKEKPKNNSVLPFGLFNFL